MQSYNPATGEILWKGHETSLKELEEKIETLSGKFEKWSSIFLEERISALDYYGKLLKEKEDTLAELISKETGKPLWEGKTEVMAMIQKIPISIDAYKIRCAPILKQQTTLIQNAEFRPHGLVAVFGPYNFPGHLPNGHIIPALLAGNVVLFKPSELTPAVGECIFQLMQEAKLPVELIQGGPTIGKEIVKHPKVTGIFFTGSAATGQLIAKAVLEEPQKILALEMGGNNPLVISEVNDIHAAAYLTVQSAFITSGQRCSCARRLIVVQNSKAEDFIHKVLELTKKIKIGPYTEDPEPFMGPVIDMNAANHIMKAQKELIKKGGKPLLEMEFIQKDLPFLSPSIIDVTGVEVPDEEIFGPVLQLIRVDELSHAIEESNRTVYGLTAGFLGDKNDDWRQFYHKVKAGVINWNTALTGASSSLPFGGIGKSGNYRPSAFLAADYCSYPVASTQAIKVEMPSTTLPGLSK